MSHSSHSFLDIWIMFTKSLEQNELVETVVIFNFIWARRNETVHSKGFSHPNLIVSRAREELHLFSLSHDSIIRPNSSFSLANALDKWQKTSPGSFKINWDVAYDQHIGRIGMGVMVWDHRGQVMGTLRANGRLTKNPSTA